MLVIEKLLLNYSSRTAEKALKQKKEKKLF